VLNFQLLNHHFIVNNTSDFFLRFREQHNAASVRPAARAAAFPAESVQRAPGCCNQSNATLLRQPGAAQPLFPALQTVVLRVRLVGAAILHRALRLQTQVAEVFQLAMFHVQEFLVKHVILNYTAIKRY